MSRPSTAQLVTTPSEDLDAAAGRHAVAGEQLHQRGLAGAVAPEQTGDGVAVDLGANGVQSDVLPKAHGDAAKGRRGVRRGYGHRASSERSSMAVTSRVEIPSLCASTIRGRRYWSANSLRRRLSSCSRAPVATNIPTPRLL